MSSVSLNPFASETAAARHGAADSVDALPNSGEWLPLPPVLASAFPWEFDGGPFLPPIALYELANPALVASLSAAARAALVVAVRYQLREELARQALPEVLLASAVHPDAVEEVRAWLSRTGVPRAQQPPVLRLRDATGFIGRRANRLLQCTDRAAPAVPPPHPSQLRTLPLRVAAIKAARGAREETPTRDCGEPGRETVVDPLQPPRRWRSQRAQASAEVAMTLQGGQRLTARDPRFGWALLRIHGLVPLAGQSWLEVEAGVRAVGNPVLAATFAWLEQSLRAAAAATTAQETRAIIESLLVRDPEKEAASAILAGRYGLNGLDLTLDECGRRFGLTRERVRQLEAAFERALADDDAYAPALAQAAAHLESVQLAPLAALAGALNLGGQTVQGAIAAAQAVLRRPAGGVAVDRLLWAPYGLRAAYWSTRLDEAQATAVLRAARAMAQRVGACQVTCIAGDVADEMLVAVTRAEVQALLDACPQFRWLDRDAGWATIQGRGEAPVFSDVRKMLAVCHPVSMDVRDIFEGLAASRRQITNRGDNVARFGGGLPPAWVFRKLLEMQPDLEVAQYDNFRLREPLEPMALMESDAEKAIYAALQRHGGAASWKELRDELVTTGVLNPITFGVMLKSASFVYQPGMGLYALRGVRFHINAILTRVGKRQFAPPAHVASTRTTLLGPDLMRVQVNQTGSTKNPVVYVPLAALPAAVGSYLSDEKPEARIRIGRTGQVARLAIELAQAGVEAGETVMLTLDTAARTYTWTRADATRVSAGPKRSKGPD